MTYEELKHMHPYKTILDKAERMMNEQTPEAKLDVRIFANITIHFSDFGSRFERLDDADIFMFTERYHQIVNKYELSTYEGSYGFLSTRINVGYYLWVPRSIHQNTWQTKNSI